MNRYFFVVAVLFISFSAFSQTYEELVSKSMDYIDAKDYAAAEVTLIEAMRKEPGNEGNILLFSNLGTIQRKLGKKQDALTSYNLALSKFPRAVFALQNRAALLCELDSLQAAKRDYTLILSIDSNNIDALYSRGLIFLSEKNFLAAETDFEQVLKINPNNVQAMSSIAFLLKSKGDWSAAEEKYTDLIYKYKNQPIFYVNRAECYLQLKKLSRAKDDLNKAKQLGYDDALLYILRGQFYLQQYDRSSAKQDFIKAQELGADAELIKGYLSLCK